MRVGSRKKISEVEELATVPFVRNLTGLIFSEKLITIARDEVVGFVSKPARQQLHDGGEGAPNSTQLLEYLNRSIGAGYQTFVGLRIVRQQVHRVQNLWVNSVPFENLAGKLTLQSGKTEAVVSVAPEDKLVKAIAESANTVIEDDWIGCVYHARPQH